MADDYLFTDGPLASQIPGFAPRQAQLTMACAVDAAIAGQRTLVVGKPALAPASLRLSGAAVGARRTGAGQLRRKRSGQLFHRDLPRIVKASGKPVKKIALLKGLATTSAITGCRSPSTAPSALTVSCWIN